MASITPDRAIFHIPGTDKGGSRPTTPKKGFNEIFNKVATLADDINIEVESTSFVSDIRPPQFSETPNKTDIVVDKLQRLIDTIESYRKRLQEKKYSLKEIQPLIKKMVVESESLSEITKKLSAQDSLQSIVNQSLILSSAEVIKFNSGFYNDGVM